jgi:hypothetical protein
MSHIIYTTQNGEQRTAHFQCTVCGETVHGPLYIHNYFVSEKACHECAVRDEHKNDFEKVVHAKFVPACASDSEE